MFWFGFVAQVDPSIRSMMALQQERGSTSYSELNIEGTNKTSTQILESKSQTMKWSRMPGQVLDICFIGVNVGESVAVFEITSYTLIHYFQHYSTNIARRAVDEMQEYIRCVTHNAVGILQWLHWLYIYH